MSCDFYRQHELGEIDDDGFEQHARDCAQCRELIELDVRLLEHAKSLQRPVAAPLLWAKIENSLRAEQHSQRRKVMEIFGRRRSVVLRLAAVVVLALSAGVYFFSRPEPSSSRLLARAALQKVEAKEKEYQEAISELERQAQPRLTTLEVDLMLLYRDRLETIEAQILRCKDAAARNPANAHIRRYLLAALQDKQQTLRELVDYRSLQL